MQEFPAYTVEGLLAADWLQLEQILDYRRARLAIDLFNAKREGMQRLAERPDLTEILLEMGRAQTGDTTSLTDVYESIRAGRPPDEGESNG